MPDKVKIHWTLNVRVAGGPTVQTAGRFEVGAYDLVDIAVDSNEEKSVAIQPSDSGVHLLLITAHPHGDALTYRVDDDDTSISLNAGIHSYFGPGSVALLGAEAPKVLHFHNALDVPTTIQILVGRDPSS